MTDDDVKLTTQMNDHDNVRKSINGIIKEVDFFIGKYGGSRELSLTKTKLEEALMWLTK